MDRSDAARLSARMPIALTIAGSDSGAGAGIQADLKTFAALGIYAASVVTAITAQNTRGVRAVHLVPPDVVAAQIAAVMEDFAVAAIKIGMLGSPGIVDVLADALKSASGEGAVRVIVYDPVMAASSGDALSGAGFVDAIRSRLLPLVDLLTPNLAEAATLLGEPNAAGEADMARQGGALIRLGPRAVLMKGGHLEGDEAVDVLVTADGARRFAAPRLRSDNLHGTGCTLSSAIAAYLVQGEPLPEAVRLAKDFVRQAIERARDVRLGAGAGPLLQAPLQVRR